MFSASSSEKKGGRASGERDWSRTEKAPWGQQAILSLVLFPSFCALDVSPLGYTVSASLENYSIEKNEREIDTENEKLSPIDDTFLHILSSCQTMASFCLLLF